MGAIDEWERVERLASLFGEFVVEYRGGEYPMLKRSNDMLSDFMEDNGMDSQPVDPPLLLTALACASNMPLGSKSERLAAVHRASQAYMAGALEHSDLEKWLRDVLISVLSWGRRLDMQAELN